MQLGQKVKCSGYLKKQRKRYCLPSFSQFENFSEEQKQIVMYADPIFIEVCDCVEQENYKVIFCEENKEFEGIVVGIKKVNLFIYYACDTHDDSFGDSKDYIYTFAKKENAISCYKVFYALGKSRLVPINMVEVINNEN